MKQRIQISTSHAVCKTFITTLAVTAQFTAFAYPSLAAETPAQNNAAGANTTGAYTESIPGTLVKFEMLPIRGGSFNMADPLKPGQASKIEVKPFWMGKTEVTWDEYDIYAFRLDLSQQDQAAGVDATSRPSKPYGAPDRGFGHQHYPALAMTQHSAELYCQWLSKKTGKKYRLPTEAEWEYACRAGATGNELFDQKTYLDDHAWYWENAEDKTHEVATKQPTPWGLYDMLGNVAEWCIASDGVGVVRGGSWRDKAPKVTPVARQVQTPDWDMTDPQNPKSKWWLSDGPFIGFRVVCEG